MELGEVISWNRSKDCLIIIGGLSIYFAENKDYIHKEIYNQFMELQNVLLENTHIVKFIKFNILRNSKHLTVKINKLISDLQDFTTF